MRICVSALLLCVFCVSAWADPLPIAPGVYSSGEPAAPLQAVAPVAAGTPVSAATSADLGGGFIQFLFGGGSAAEQPTGPSAYQPSPAYSRPTPPALAAPAPMAVVRPAPSDEAAAEPVQRSVDPKYDRQIVVYDGKEQPGTIIIDTPHKFLYLVEAGGKAIRYGIGVGRPGFTWAGAKTITAKREWPDWRPPDDMLKRQPELPRFMAGGPDNPLGARALYLGSTLYRIHGSNEPWTIGHNVSSGCIRLRNADVIDLYNRVKVGTNVVVM